MKFSRVLAPVVAGFLMSACSISSVFEAIVDDLQAQALQSIIDNAKANEGDAVVFKAADGADLTIASGSIAGARVVIPANALPEGVDEAVLAISYDGLYAVPGTEYVAGGNTVQVTLQVVPTLEDVGELVTDATVYVPFGDAVSTAEDEAAVGLGHDVGGTIEIITAEVDLDAGLVSGGTTTFSPFLAVLPAPEELPQDVVVYTYSVTDASGTLCEGSVLESAMAATFESTIQTAAIADTWVDLWLDDTAGASVYIMGGWFAAPVLLDGPASMTEVTWNIDVTNCGGSDYMFDAVAVEGTMSNWVESDAQAQADCGQTNDQACTRHVGMADAAISTSAAVNTTLDVFLTLSFNGEVIGSVEALN